MRPARAHHGRKSLLDAKLCAGQVCANHGVPIVCLHAHGQTVARNRGVVHQNVEVAKFLEDRLESGLNLFGLGDIHLHCEGFSTRPDNLLCQRGELFLIARGDGDFGAGFG